MMIKLCLIITLIFTVAFWLSFPAIAADDPIENRCPGPNCKPNTQGNNANAINLGNQFINSGLGIQSPAQGGIIGTILRNVLTIFFAVGGIGTLIYFIWGAVDWILSGGDKEKVSSARKKMTHAIIGLVLLALSFFIIQVVGEVIGFNPLQTIQIKSLGEQ